MTAGTRRRFYLVVLVLLYALLVWRMPYSLKHFPLRVLDWLVPAAALSAWAVARWRRREPWPASPANWPLLAWWGALAVAAVFSGEPRASLHAQWEAGIGVLLLWLLIDAVRRGWGSALWQGLYLLGAVVCAVGAIELVAWYLGWPLLPQFQQGWPPLGGLADPLPPTIHRIGVALVNITALSAFLALLIPPALCVALSTRQRDTRWGMMVWVAAAGVLQLLSFSRGGLLALGVSLPALLLGATRSPGWRRAWLAIRPRMARLWPAGVGLVVLPVLIGAALLIAWQTGQGGHESGDAVRLDLWRSAADMFRDNPLTGVGPAGFGPALRSYRNPLLARDHIVTAHNLYLNTAAEGGLLALIAGAWLIFTLARAGWRQWSRLPPGSPAWWRTLGAGSALAGLAVQSAVDTFVEPAVVLPALFFAAVLLAGERPGEAAGGRPRRWPWAAAVALLLAGAAFLAWESVGGAALARSLSLTQRGEIAPALAAAEQARHHDPGEALYACHAGYLYGRQAAEGDAAALAPAVERYRTCLAEVPVPGWADQLNLAVLLWQMGETAEARSAVAQATAQTPLEPLPWLSRGAWAEAGGDREEAVESYGWVLALDPDVAGSRFWQEGERPALWADIVAAGAEAARRLGIEPDRWRWQVALASDSAESLIPEMEAYCTGHLTDAEPLAWLGAALLRAGRPREALAWLDRSVAADPGRAASYLARGAARAGLDDLDRAEKDVRTALFLDAGYRAHLALARLARARHDDETALHEYGLALRGLPMVHAYDLVLYRWMSWPLPLPQALRIGYREDGEAALEWGALLEERGEWATARQVYRAALALDPFMEDVRSRLEKAENR